jgi:hypothetical protein
MKIGNIVSPITITVSEDFNVVESIDNIIDGLPTLIIGWDYVKKNFPDYNILNRTLGPNVFWTFKRTERRDWFEEDLFNFTEHCYKFLVRNITYFFCDFILLSKAAIRKFIRKIYTSSNIISYEHDGMIYVYVENFIFGIDLNQLMFLDENIDKIKTKIKRVSRTFLIKEDIFIKYKKRVEYLDNQWKFVPYLYQKENG